jgi:hypothetical protein
MEKTKYGAYEFPENELKLEAAIFADGSRIIPRISVSPGRKYIAWKDNGDSAVVDYPNKILELYNNSSLHHSIIDMKAMMIAGAGLEVVDPNNPMAEETNNFLTKLNDFGQDANEINFRIALDQELFNGFSVQSVFKKDWSKIDSLLHLEFNKIRIETPDSEGAKYGYYWAFDWGQYRPTRMHYFEGFNYNTADMKKQEFSAITKRIMEHNKEEDVEALKNFILQGNSQLYYYKKYAPNCAYYPLANYIACVPAIEIDILSDIYAQASLTNGMDNGIMITILGDASDPESQKSAKRILKSYAGARKAGKPVIVFTPSFEEAPKIEDIGNSNSLAQKYNVINQSVQQKILSGHRINSSTIVGIQISGKLGSMNELSQAEEIFFNKYVIPQQVALNQFWNRIMKFNGLGEVRIINRNVFNEAKIDTKEAGMITEQTAAPTQQKTN